MAYEEIVTTSRKINGKDLSADITLTPADVGALPTNGGTMTGAIDFKNDAGTNYGFAGINNGNLYMGYSTRNGVAFKSDRVHFRGKVDFTNTTLQGISASDVGAQSKITANGFLKGDGNGNITAEKPVFIVNITPTEPDGSIGTADKTAAEILSAYNAGYTIQAVYDDVITLQLTSIGADVDAIHIMFSTSMYQDGSGVGYGIAHTDSSESWHIYQTEMVPTTRTINGKALSSDITLTAADVGATSLTDNQTISGDRTINSNISLAANNDSSNKLTVGIPTIFKNNVNFTNATVSGLTTAAVGTTTDYSIYIGSTAPAANTAPLIWIDTSTSGVMKYRTSTTSTTWTAVPVAWG